MSQNKQTNASLPNTGTFSQVVTSATRSEESFASLRGPALAHAKAVLHRWQFRRLSRKGRIEITDVQPLERVTRGAVAKSLWHLCDEVTRHALRNDAHAHVRSIAFLSTLRTAA